MLRVPVQPPLAVHWVALLVDQLNVSESPGSTSVLLALRSTVGMGSESGSAAGRDGDRVRGPGSETSVLRVLTSPLQAASAMQRVMTSVVLEERLRQVVNGNLKLTPFGSKTAR